MEACAQAPAIAQKSDALGNKTKLKPIFLVLIAFPQIPTKNPNQHKKICRDRNLKHETRISDLVLTAEHAEAD